jgi:FkbM family methyltransferase
MKPQISASPLRKAVLCLNKHSRRDFRFFRQFPSGPFRTVLDIGAYHGEFTDRMLRHHEVERVFLFEPFADSVAFLQKLYQAEPRCEVLPYALSDQSGSTNLQVLNHADSSSLLAPSGSAGELLHRPFHAVQTTQIETRRLDELPALQGIEVFDIAKIDVQGAELKVLQGCGKLLDRIQSIYIEVNFVSLYEGGAVFCETHAFLEEAGFKLGFMQEFRRNEMGVLIYANAFYFRTAGR